MNGEKMAVSSHFVDNFVDKSVLFFWVSLKTPVDFVDNLSKGC